MQFKPEERSKSCTSAIRLKLGLGSCWSKSPTYVLHGLLSTAAQMEQGGHLGMETQEETRSTSSPTTQWDLNHPGPTPPPCPTCHAARETTPEPTGTDAPRRPRYLHPQDVIHGNVLHLLLHVLHQFGLQLHQHPAAIRHSFALGAEPGTGVRPRRPLPMAETCVCLQRALLQRKEIRLSISASASKVESVWAAQRHQEGFSQREEPGAENAVQYPNNKASLG